MSGLVLLALLGSSVAIGDCKIYRQGRAEPCQFQKPKVVAPSQGPELATRVPDSGRRSTQPDELGFSIDPHARLRDLRFRSHQEFLETWKRDTQTLLRRAIDRFAQPSQKAQSASKDTRSWYQRLSERLFLRTTPLRVSLVPDQSRDCRHGVGAFVFTRDARLDRNQMYACPTMIDSTWTEAIQTMIHEEAHLELKSADECLMTSIEYAIATAGGLVPVPNGYHQECVSAGRLRVPKDLSRH